MRDQRGRFTAGITLHGAKAGQTVTLGRQADESPPEASPTPTTEARPSDDNES